LVEIRKEGFSDVSGTNSVPIFRVCWWFGRKELFPETSENLHILKRLSAQENFIEIYWQLTKLYCI